MTYKLKKDPINNLDTLVKINENGRELFLPFDPANTDYAQFLKDIKEGVELLDADGNVVTDFVKELP